MNTTPAMGEPIVQSVLFRDSAEELFNTWLDSAAHAKRAGRGTAELSRETGAEFRIFDGGLRGRNVAIVPHRMIVQTWRASAKEWPETAPDSLLILTFSDDARGGRIDLVHLNVPEAALDVIRNGWTEHYWKPWGGVAE